jgi:hypothetical protein
MASVPLMLIVFLVSSCQKEVSYENAAKAGGTAKYSFDLGTGSCADAIVSGSFTTGIAATPANTVTLAVNVDSIGTYIISTSKVNGVSFSGSGSFTNTGVQTITLTASGIPKTTGTFDFTPAANACTFSITVAPNNTGGGGSGAAVFSFNGGTSACTGAAVSGVYTVGTATTTANKVVLNIKVDQAGSYTISTNTVNGIKFAGTGSFTTTGVQTVTLTASGTPAAAGSFSFTPGSNACSFNVTVVAGGGTGGGSGSGNFLKCKIDGVLVNFNAGLVGYYVPPPSSGIPYSVSVMGKNSDVANSKEEFWVVITNPTAPTTGTYTNRTLFSAATDRASQATFYPTGFPNLYWGVSVMDANTLTVNITSVSTSGAAGTFDGTIYEGNGIGPATKKITEGQFKITY